MAQATYWESTNKILANDISTGLITTASFHSSKVSGNNDLVLDVYGGSSGSLFSRAAGGSRSSPSATVSNQEMLLLSARGWIPGTTNGGGSWSNPRAEISLRSVQTWSSTAQGTKMEFRVTPTGQSTMVTVASFTSNGLELPAGKKARITDSDGSHTMDILPSNLTAAQTYTFPDATGDIPLVLNRAPTKLEVKNTTTETIVYNLTVPANALGTTKTLRVVFQGDYENSTGSAQNLTLKVKYGGSTFYSDVVSISTGTPLRPLLLTLYLSNQNYSDVQLLTGTVDIGNNSSPTIGIGRIGTGGGGGILAIASEVFEQVVESAQAQTFEISVKFDAADQKLSLRRRHAYTVLE
jgi:hypothetical protein